MALRRDKQPTDSSNHTLLTSLGVALVNHSAIAAIHPSHIKVRLMIPENVGRRFWDRLYTGFFVFFALYWPLGGFLPGLREGKPNQVIIPIINTLLIFLVWYFCSQPGMPFFRALGVISASVQSGCIQMTVMLMPWFLAFALSVALYFTIIGLFKGRSYTQERWMKFVTKQFVTRQSMI